jgi:hypothetical protein
MKPSAIKKIWEAHEKLEPEKYNDPWLDKTLAQLEKLKGEMGYVRVVSRDELEKAKVELGLKPRVSKKTAKRALKESKKKKSKKSISLHGLRKFINKQLNIFINNQYTIHFDGKVIKILDTQLELEHSFILIDSTELFSPYGLLAKWEEVFKCEDRFHKRVDLKHTRPIPDLRTGRWVNTDLHQPDEHNNYTRTEYSLAEGGFVDVEEATYRKFDMVPSLLCRNEYVLTQEAVRGAGMGSYIEGAKFLTLLAEHYEKEAKKYAHRR